MSMPTKGKHHHLPHHHQHHSQPQQPHHNPQHQPQLLVNVNQPSIHSPQGYNTVVSANTPRFVPNAGEYKLPNASYRLAFTTYQPYAREICRIYIPLRSGDQPYASVGWRLCFEVRRTMRSMWLSVRKIL